MTDVPPAGTPVCYRHSGRETYIRCTRCDRPICPDCMREASVGHQCPECVAEGRRTQRQTRTAFGGSTVGRQGYVTIALIVINVLMLLLSLASAKNPGNAAAGGGLGGLLGGGYAADAQARRDRLGRCQDSPRPGVRLRRRATASTTACSPRCSCTTACCTC